MKWLRTNNNFQPIEGSFDSYDTIPTGVYNIILRKGMGGISWELEKCSDKFDFSFKLYGLESDFIDYVIKTYNNTEGNLGILLNGMKGSGKSVCAKVICNRLKLPVLIVRNMGEDNDLMLQFLNSLNFDCILFLDEYEKQFKDERSDSTVLLQITDGVYTSKYRKLFLLTTNELSIDKNLIGRPSRIRYVKTFKNLPIQVIKEYLNDNLNDKSKADEIIDFVSELAISTIDILKTIVSEVNIHGSLHYCKSFFNTEPVEYRYTCIRGYVLAPAKAIPEKELVKKFISAAHDYHKGVLEKDGELFSLDWRYITSDVKLSSLSEGDWFHYDEIKSVYRDYNVIVTADDRSLSYYLVLNPDYKPTLYKNLDLAL